MVSFGISSVMGGKEELDKPSRSIIHVRPFLLKAGPEPPPRRPVTKSDLQVMMISNVSARIMDIREMRST